ncbi:thiol reductant ABC exporter subunit CydD [Antrihabitans sp. YC3-6]|uniref:Thiol reductant ABC exporter subunit CydD n=1 Tax=Antrihabitans stalagmiti TaxID=2799499 RepID=A0A934U582_9NOCA|nr:thiol reductant ABC exporter subunit CydD [Antrihabitans stalagmiti]MBJ8341279.1 thiol reductant ABC exporter subunit CydD [Antrihabitans stalagmiti]
MRLATEPRNSRGPIDPRLWKYSRSARSYLVLTVILSLVATIATVVSALCVGGVLAGVITEPDRRNLAAWTFELAVLCMALGARVLAVWAQGRFGHRAASRVVAELESEVLEAGANLQTRELDSRRANLTFLVSQGLDDLRQYLAGYLPALVLATVVPPIVLVVIAWHDLVSAVIIVVTLPLIPIFMVLIGLLTKHRSEATLETMSALSAQLLDLLAGLPTLRALGRERGPARRVRELGDAHRKSAMAALRVAFLSAFVLELLATLCVALVAVSIGLRLVFGEMTLMAGLVALILAPEVYQPLRAVGAKFHAAANGKAAADQAFEVLETTTEEAVGRGLTPVGGTIELEHVSIRTRSGFAPHNLSACLEPGRVTVLVGMNGAGKSTALQAIIGLNAPDEGRVIVGGRDVAGVDLQEWWSQVGWLPQRPVLVPGTLRENLELTGSIAIGADRLAAACAATGFDAVLDELPHRWATLVGEGGVGLSLGQRQRLALTRVLAGNKQVLLLDEPTAHLDDASEARVLQALVDRARSGVTVVVVGHRPAVLATADVLVEVRTDA